MNQCDLLIRIDDLRTFFHREIFCRIPLLQAVRHGQGLQLVVADFLLLYDAGGLALDAALDEIPDLTGICKVLLVRLCTCAQVMLNIGRSLFVRLVFLLFAHGLEDLIELLAGVILEENVFVEP